MSEAKQRRAKRANGEGGASQRPDGTWQYRVTVSGGRRIYGYGKTQAEAKKRCLDKAALVEQGVDLKAVKQTLANFLDYWLTDVVASKNAPKTAQSYSYLMRNHVIPELGKVELGKLTAQRVQSLLNRKERSGLSARTVAHIRTVLKTALNHAVRIGAVQRNVVALTEPPRQTPTERHPFTAEEARALLATIENDRLAALWRTALTLGLRRGELIGLRWQDIDLERGTLRVEQTVQRINKKLVIQTPKTARSRRTLSLPESLVTALRAHRLRQIEERLAATRWTDSGHVFTTRVGTALDPDYVSRDWKKLLKQIGIREQRLHDLRHAAATLMISNGLPLPAVSEALGHSQTSTTLNVYAHALPAARRQVADTMERLLG